MFNTRNNQKGFTLIELLVVVAIIGVLASVVLSSLNSARNKARTSKIIQDFKQIERALHLFYADYGCWPNEISGTGCIAIGTINTGTQSGAGAGYSSGLNGVTIQNAIDNSNVVFRQYIPQAPSFPFTSENGYYFDNDNNIHDEVNCLTVAGAQNGVNIAVKADFANLSDIANSINKQIDGEGTLFGGGTSSEDLGRRCGKVRMYFPNVLFYSISNTP